PRRSIRLPNGRPSTPRPAGMEYDARWAGIVTQRDGKTHAAPPAEAGETKVVPSRLDVGGASGC
ncbi:MAG TPA: hypothetical protein VEY93_15220, partial [Longimicrobium sp.]|nr:hypothetical protein [Longimicrobium sp.]